MRTREKLAWLISLALLVAVVWAYVPRAEPISGTVRIVDGDSLYVGDTEVRLFGVDAFEGDQTCLREGHPWRCGQAATDALRELTDDRAITCNKKDTDRYRRSVSVCSNGTSDLSAELTRKGLALAYREFSSDYIDEEDEARGARRGAWAGEFTAPWDERQRPRDTSRAETRNESEDTLGDCRGTGIKGNIRNGRRLYHVPGSSSYDDTVIDESQGERWFCTRADALREGWLPPQG